MPAKASTGRRLDAALASPARGPRRPPGLPAGSPPPTLARGPAPTPALKPGAGVRRACGVHPYPFTGTVPRAHRASRRPRLTAPPSQLTPAGGSPSFTVGPDGLVIHRPPSGMGYATATTSGRPAPSTARQDATASMRRTPRPSPAPVPRPARRTHGRGGETRRRQAPPMSAVDTHSSANFRAPGWTKLGERNPKPLPGLHTFPGGLSCAPYTPATPLMAPESAWRPTEHTTMGQLAIERNSVSRGPPDANVQA